VQRSRCQFAERRRADGRGSLRRLSGRAFGPARRRRGQGTRHHAGRRSRGGRGSVLPDGSGDGSLPASRSTRPHARRHAGDAHRGARCSGASLAGGWPTSSPAPAATTPRSVRSWTIHPAVARPGSGSRSATCTAWPVLATTRCCNRSTRRVARRRRGARREGGRGVRPAARRGPTMVAREHMDQVVEMAEQITERLTGG